MPSLMLQIMLMFNEDGSINNRQLSALISDIRRMVKVERDAHTTTFSVEELVVAWSITLGEAEGKWYIDDVVYHAV